MLRQLVAKEIESRATESNDRTEEVHTNDRDSQAEGH